MPKQHALDFLIFALRNPRACPLLGVSAPGRADDFGNIARSSAVRTDLPRYAVFRYGRLVEEPTDISHLWNDEMVAFLLGCSFSWEQHLAEIGLVPRNVDVGVNVSMYETCIPNVASGPFSGNVVVSMRPYAPKDVQRVIQVTSTYTASHGGPIHVGDPTLLGLSYDDLKYPKWGDRVPFDLHEDIPCFWACGVTPQAAICAAKLPLAISHSPDICL